MLIIIKSTLKVHSPRVIILLIYIIIMLGTNVKPQARFKAVRTVLKPSGWL